MEKPNSKRPLLWLLILIMLIGVIAAGWHWAGSSSGGVAVLPVAPPSNNKLQLIVGDVPIVTPPAQTPPAADDAAQPRFAMDRGPVTAPAVAAQVQQPVNPVPSAATIKEDVKNPTPEELAAIPPPPEAAAAMKAGPPPDILRGMQNPPQHMLQGLKNPPPEFKNALNPPGTPPPAPQPPK